MSNKLNMGITIDSIIAASDRIKTFLHNTPVLANKIINEMTSIDFYFKCGNFQKIGGLIVMPTTSPIVKVNAVKKYGTEFTMYEPNQQGRLVSDDKIKAALRLIYERTRIIKETSCVVPFVAALKKYRTI